MSKRFRSIAFVVLFALFATTIGVSHFAQVDASPIEVIGNPEGASLRALVGNENGQTNRIVYFAAGTKTMSGANTPVPSDTYCGGQYSLHKAEVILTGTMTGTAPTLAIKWQNSIDGGTNWTDVGTWTTINATVTPPSQAQTVADIYNATTAVAYGDCWRATYTFGGSGTVTANISIKGFEK